MILPLIKCFYYGYDAELCQMLQKTLKYFKKVLMQLDLRNNKI